MPTDDYGQAIAPEGSAKVQLAEFGMPTAFQLGCRKYGHAYYAELQNAARTMRLGMEEGPDPVDGRWHTAVDPCVLLQSIVLSAMQRASGFVEVPPTIVPMEETQRSGPGVARKDRLGDILWDFLQATARDLQTGEGLCFCRDGARSDRTIARTVNRIEAEFG